MARLTVPIKISGVQAMRVALNKTIPKWDPDTTDEYKKGFMDCFTKFRLILDALEGDEE